MYCSFWGISENFFESIIGADIQVVGSSIPLLLIVYNLEHELQENLKWSDIVGIEIMVMTKY